jgi:hypothetical protein
MIKRVELRIQNGKLCFPYDWGYNMEVILVGEMTRSLDFMMSFRCFQLLLTPFTSPYIGVCKKQGEVSWNHKPSPYSG